MKVFHIECNLMGNELIADVMELSVVQPGPSLAVTVLMHGNEPCGLEALKAAMAEDFALKCGRLSLILMNRAAHDASGGAVRHLGIDMNHALGFNHALGLVKAELDVAQALMGAARVEQLHPGMIRRPAIVPATPPLAAGASAPPSAPPKLSSSKGHMTCAH
jgi:hypothetical protein